MTLLRVKKNTISCKVLLFTICMLILTACNNSRKYGGNNLGQVSLLQTSDGTSEIGFESKDLPVLSKTNLQTLLLGKNRIEVEEIMGVPEGKSLDGGNGYLWDYRRPIFDDSTEQVYEWSLVSFKFIGGLCTNINIRLENPPTFLLSKEQDFTTSEESPQ
jgi:hypothetical protein